MPQSLVRMNPPSLPDAAKMGYSQITTVEPGRMAYISGQVAWRPDGQPVPDDLVEQTRIVTAHARAALNALGATPQDIVIARVFMLDLNPETLGQVFPPLREMFNGAEPCITGVGVASLAAPELKIEMELTVRLPD
ncbi:RidA family protein [Biostraticola tofi]|uniref:Enamine deaminase RidA (YjgF/YER057c/UK114 family) n=1 Tax=Biostraticola tofi TaxID=466109 RepID=A0A4R3Z486_9GAMM|nr:RidA family protein [Biostraticola tofi]TCV98718.1 enamine deaminase RidA (YjgF/YER057c/UK114 family) [Biostraticola tofi]